MIQCSSLPRVREYTMDLIKGSRCLFTPEDCHFPAVSGIHRKLSIHVLSGSLNSSGS